MSARRSTAALVTANCVPALHRLSLVTPRAADVDAVLLDQSRPTTVDLEKPVFLDSGNRIDELGYYAVLLWEYRVKSTMEVGEVEVPTLLRSREGGGWEYLVSLPKTDELNYRDISELTVVVKKPNEWTMDHSRQANNPQQRHAFSVREAIEDMEMHEGPLALSNDPDEQAYYNTQELLEKAGLVRSLLLTLSPSQLIQHWGWGLELSLMLIPDFDDEKGTHRNELLLIKQKQQDYLKQLKFRREQELATLEREQRCAPALDHELYN
jgi:hypothetical protein